MTTCTLRACRTCTGCAHSNHSACRGVVRCPDDGQERACECCGQSKSVDSAGPP